MTARIAELLLHQFIQISIVVLIALLVDWFFRQRNLTRFRYVLWLFVLLKMLTPPVIASPTGLFSIAQMSSEVPTDCGVAVINSDLSRFQQYVLSHPGLVQTMVVTWLVGVGILFFVWAGRLKKVAHQPGKSAAHRERCRRIVDEVCTELRVSTRPVVSITTSNFGPAVYGLIQPRIVIPESVLDQVSDEELRPVIAHELIHIKRRDTWVGMLQLVAAVCWWFHPLAWIAIRRLSESLELVTDDDVVAVAGVKEHDYAHSLLSVIEAGTLSAPVTGTVGVFTCQVTDTRIRRLISRQTHRSHPALSIALAIVMAVVILPGKGLLISASTTASTATATHSLTSSTP